MDAYLDPLRNYARFEGRSSPSSFWVFAILNLVAFNLLFQLDLSLGWLFSDGGFGYLSTAFAVAMLVPTVAVAVRRLHDSGLDGVLVLVGLVPVIGWIVLFFMLVRSSQRGPNRFGPDPTGWVPVEAPADGSTPEATARRRGTVTCPWCGKSNPVGRVACQWCHRQYRDPPAGHV